MSTAITTVNPDVLSTVLAPLSSIPFPDLPRVDSGLVVSIGIPKFKFHIEAPIMDFAPATQTGTVLITVPIDPSVIIVLTLKGKLDEGQSFQIQETDLKVDRVRDVARADFISSTFLAMMGLAEAIQISIPDIGLNLELKIELTLPSLSEMLQRRLLSYRIMTIERALRHEFALPSYVQAEEVKSIALIHKAIVQRSFDWPINYIEYGFPATKEVYEQLASKSGLPAAKLLFPPKTEKLFDKVVSLGPCFITLEDMTIENLEKGLSELAVGDGHIVNFVFRSKTGHGKYEFQEAPRLPASPWDFTIEQFMSVESELDMQLAAKLNKLAAETLGALSESEKLELTVMPRMDDEAFSLES